MGAVSSIGNAISGAVSGIAGVVGSVVHGVGDAIDNTVKSIEKDPTTALVDVALIASGNPEMIQYVNPGIQIAQGADPTKVLESAVLSQGIGYAANDVANSILPDTSDTMGMLEKKGLSGATSGGLRALATGKDPLTGALSGGINSAANAELKDATGQSWLPNVNAYGALTNPNGTPVSTASNIMSSPIQTASNNSPTVQPTSSTSMPTLGLKDLSVGNLDIGSNSMQNLGITNLAQPTGMMPLGRPTMSAKDGGSIEDHIDPELLRLLKERGMTFDHHKPKGYADGSSVEDLTNSLNEKEIKEGWKGMSALATPQFAKTYEPKMLSLQGNGQGSKYFQPLTQMNEGPLSQLIHRAHGGKAKEYEEAAPKGHKPEFITGLTGYYAHGKGTGQSDDIPAMLHDGDYVADADLVAALGDGSSKAGAEALEKFRRSIPHHESAGGQPVAAQIADGEYVFSANFVTAIGHGDNKAGAKLLDKMREEVRKHKRSAPTSKIPPKAKSPLDYLKMAAKG